MGKSSTSVKPGQVLNPKGRPKKGYSITEMMKEMLKERPEIKKGIGQQIAKKALQGDMAAINKLWQYMDGMPKQSHEHSGQDGEAIEVIIKDYGDRGDVSKKAKGSI